MRIDELTIDRMAVISKLLRSSLPGLNTVLLIAEDASCRIVSNINPPEMKDVLTKTLRSMDTPQSEIIDGNVNLECRVKLKLVPVPGQPYSRVDGVKLLCPFPKTAEPALLDDENQMTLLGAHIATDALVHALASNIHYGHQRKLWDSADHLRYAIRLLEDLFVQQAEITTGHGMQNF